jgi:GntR family transcriptional regulator
LEYLSGFSEDMHQMSLRPLSKVLHQASESATPVAAAQLQLQVGAPIACLKRVRLADGIPMALEQACLSLALCPDILDQDFENGSLYAYLSDRGLRPTRANQTLSAGIPTTEEKQLLGLKGQVAVMRIKRTTFMANGKAVEYVESVYRGDKYQFNVILNQGGGSGMPGKALSHNT